MSSQPVERVAIVGATGHIGQHFAKSLIEGGKHTVTAITRPESTSKAPEGAKSVKVSYTDEDALAEALKGQQFLIITLPGAVPNSVHSAIVRAAAKAGVPYVMPNAYGYHTKKEDGDLNDPNDSYVAGVVERVEEVGATGVCKCVVLSCGFWYEWSLALGESFFGISIKDRTATFYDDGERVISVSTWENCGRAIAALLSQPQSALDGYAQGKGVLVASFRVSQRSMLDSVHRVLGTTDADFSIRHEPTEKRIKDGAEELAAGNRMGFAKMLYARGMAPGAKSADYAATDGTANEALGLPKEDLDEATKRTVAMVESGWTPF